MKKPSPKKNAARAKKDEHALLFEQFGVACDAVNVALKVLATSPEFASVPKAGPVIFALSIVDQVNKVLGRVHPDGRFELSPRKA